MRVRQSDCCYLISGQALIHSHAFCHALGNTCNNIEAGPAVSQTDYKLCVLGRMLSHVMTNHSLWRFLLIIFFFFFFSFRFDFIEFLFLTKLIAHKKQQRTFQRQTNKTHISHSRVCFNSKINEKKIVKQPNLCLIVVISHLYVYAIWVFFLFHVLPSVRSFIRHGVEAKISTWNICLYDFIIWHFFFTLSQIVTLAVYCHQIYRFGVLIVFFFYYVCCCFYVSNSRVR